MWTLLKDYRVSLAVVVAAVMVIWWVRDWQYSTFVTRIDSATEALQIDLKFNALVEATKLNTQVIERNFNEFRLYTAVKSVEQYEDALYQYETDMRGKTKSPNDDIRGASLRTRLAKAQGYKQCILEVRKDCEELLKLWRDRD